MKEVTLCGRGRCCPKLGIPTKADDGETYYTLKDDFGGSCKLTKEHLVSLGKIINNL